MPRAIRRKTRRRAAVSAALADTYREDIRRLILGGDVLAIIDFARHAQADLLRRAAMDALLADEVGVRGLQGFVDLCIAVEVAPMLPRLRRIARNPRRDMDLRASAAAVLAEADPPDFAALRQTCPAVVERLSRLNATATLFEIERDPHTGPDAILEQFIDCAPEQVDAKWAELEAARAEVGTPAGLVYRQVLQSSGLEPLRARAVELLAREADATAIDVLQAAVDAAWQADVSRLRDALDRARRAPRPTDPPARAWMSCPDAAGRHVFAIALDRPCGRALFACIGVDRSGMRRHTGYVDPEAQPESMDDVIDRLARRVGPLAIIPPAQAAALTRRAAEISDDVDTLHDGQDWGAYFAFRRVTAVEPAAVEPGQPPDTDWLAEALDAEPFEWRWHARDLADWAPDPPDAADDAAWIERCIDAARDRADDLAFAARRAAQWFEWAGDADAAGRMVAAARAVEDDPTAAPLLRMTAERTCAALAEAARAA